MPSSDNGSWSAGLCQTILPFHLGYLSKETESPYQPQHFLNPPSIVPTASAYNFTVQFGTRQRLSIERLFAGHEVACKQAPPFKRRSVEI